MSVLAPLQPLYCMRQVATKIYTWCAELCGWEVAQCVKYLPNKDMDTGLDPQHPHKNRGLATSACNPSS